MVINLSALSVCVHYLRDEETFFISNTYNKNNLSIFSCLLQLSEIFSVSEKMNVILMNENETIPFYIFMVKVVN